LSFDSIKNIFLSRFQDDPPSDYVSCINLRKIPESITLWKIHKDEYVDWASKLALCTHYNQKLRECSETLAELVSTSYRRLENYTEYTCLVERKNREWKGYGKILEITLYLKYESEKRPSWSRHYEVRMYISIPLSLMKYKEVITPNTVIETAKSIFDYLEMPFAFVEALKPDKKIGYREIRSRIVSYGEGGYKQIPLTYAPYSACPLALDISEKWCNGVERATFDTAYFIVYDYIQGRIYFAEEYFYPDQVLEILSLLYDAVLEEYSYW